MKFTSYLTEATLLRRPLKFLAEVALPSQQKLTVRCPNLARMLGCDILGTRVWFSNPTGLHCLPTWELAETDGGHIVGVNPELLKPLFKEGIRNKHYKNLVDFDLIYDEAIDRVKILRLESKDSACYVGLEHVTLADEAGHGYFPDAQGDGIETIKHLIRLRKENENVKLCYCALHTGVNSIKPAKHISAEYNNLLQTAIKEGVEVIAYRSIISLYNMELSVPVPVMIPERIETGFGS